MSDFVMQWCIYYHSLVHAVHVWYWLRSFCNSC